ncbi:hypothetical protein DAEQUDRAFT_761607 [Daedalea quercina L-15889]|uniref:Uncharacterized protein n=1 Tax=Daedalea quercina L-15889 TaxID=1314783 RepID=A0A165TZB0_9APHY|nr:hypothetical protein DAEQUDRAFT_761607 [Daedalea quercina L-15889]
MLSSPLCLRIFLRARGILFVALLLSAFVLAAATNRTIDDTYGDSVTGALPSYSESWNIGQECTGCRVQPSPSDVFRGSWHDTTSDNPNTTTHSVTLSFQGTAIWVYCVLVNSGEAYITIYSNMSFELDGSLAGTFSHVPNPDAQQYLYNQTVFGKTGLSNTDHTLVMTAELGSEASVLLFDWAMYTFDNDPTTTGPSPTSSPALSVGGSTPPAVASNPTSDNSKPTGGSSEPVTATGSPNEAGTSVNGQSNSGTDTATGQGSTGNTKSATGSETTQSVTDSSSSRSTGVSATGSTATPASKLATTHHGTPIGVIVGGGVGGFMFVMLCICLVICCRRRRISRRGADAMEYKVTEPAAASTSPNSPDVATVLQVKHTSVLSAVPTSDDAAPLLIAADPSSLIVHPSTVEMPLCNGKHSEDILSDHESLAREAQHLRQQVATLRAEQSVIETNSETATVRRRSSRSALAITMHGGSSSRSAEEDNEALRRELAHLRTEIARLRTGTGTGFEPDDSEPPPAYYS